MDLKDGGFDGAPPPVAGLGNFKGVMLCNRPADSTSKTGGIDGGNGPFRSMVSATHDEMIGLTPCKSFEPTVKTRGPSAALRRHVRWLKELQDQMREERESVDEDERAADQRKKKMQVIFEKHREAVREMMQVRDVEDAAASKEEDARKAASRKKDQKSKPLWAMTEKEKDNFEEADGDELIAFAEDLDFDKYMGDLEFRQGIEALKDRHGKISKEQDAFKDQLIAEFNAKAAAEDDDERETSAGGGSPRDLGLDGQSVLGSEYSLGSGAGSRRSGRAREARGDPREAGWDTSTQGGDDRPPVDEEVRSNAEMVLESNTAMRGIHSKASVQKIIEKARGIPEEPFDLIAEMRRSAPCSVPVIVASSDTQTRLHKPPDPSCLPYLYRSPAI